MKKLSKIVSLILSLALCLGMASPAFAANFTDLQNAIDGVMAEEIADEHANGTKISSESEPDRYGYGWNAGTEENGGYWGIEAWDDDETGRNVQLNEDVVRDDNDIIHYNNNRTEQRKVIDIGKADLVLDLNGQKIDGASRDMSEANIYGMVLKGFGSTSTATIKNGTITGSQKDGIFAAGSGTLHLENVDVVGNKDAGVDTRADFTMTDGSIKNNGGFGLLTGPQGGKGTFEVKDTTISGNGFQGQDKNNGHNGAGIFMGSWTGTITNTTIEKNAGRGIFMCGGSDITLDEVTIQDNDGGIVSEGTLTIKNSTIVGNHAPDEATYWSQKTDGGGIYAAKSAVVDLGNNNEIHSNTDSTGASDIYAVASATVNGLNVSPKAPAAKQFDGWYGENGKGSKYVGPEKIEADVNLVGNLSDVTEVPDNDTDTTLGGAILTPDAVDAPADTTIADQAVPLAGLVSLAELLNALHEYEGIEDVELPEDFQWIDHEYAQAIYWGLQEALVADTEDEPLDPDEIVTVAILREVLENYVEYKGVDLTVTVEGEEDDEIVFDLGERLIAFYGELETALKAKAA